MHAMSPRAHEHAAAVSSAARSESSLRVFSPGLDNRFSEYFIYFDHEPASGRDDKFEIAGGAYRLFKSACFQRGEDDLPDLPRSATIPRGAAAVQRQVTVCQSCHENVHASGVPRVQGVSADSATCLDCHMPKRRTKMRCTSVSPITTFSAAGRRAIYGGDSRDGRAEAWKLCGEVALYYPKTLPPTAENELFLALAQVQQESNLTAGIRRLEQAIEKSPGPRDLTSITSWRIVLQGREPTGRHPLVGRGASA